ncbi:hypothetical protein GH714_039943 [Hevea brasiliensis]|uniref:protein-serine/threonine phosphatase n=1 Tax=Hevea brasiliensis TaxID=3981 RepID=A0A6A6MTH5_HEVBR|nr:hypothetical protein GH714_039943 [Hevea brasiliensis]
MNQLTVIKTINSRRRRLKIRRLKYTCKTKTYVTIPGDQKTESTDSVHETKASDCSAEISLSSTSSSDNAPSKNEVVISSFEENEFKKSDDLQGFKRVSYGSVSVIGRRREMEDAVRVELGFTCKGGEKYDFFGVYDGHGGARVSEACRERLHRVLEEEIVEGRAGMGIEWDKPDRPDELERVEAAGGRIINWNGHRVLGVLATSRSIGDRYLKPFIICKPEVTVNKRTKNDEFLILASDGLWDVISNEVACQIVRRCLRGRMRRKYQEVLSEGRAAEAAAVLVELAIARGSKDNISVVVVELNKLGISY